MLLLLVVVLFLHEKCAEKSSVALFLHSEKSSLVVLQNCASTKSKGALGGVRCWSPEVTVGREVKEDLN